MKRDMELIRAITVALEAHPEADLHLTETVRAACLEAAARAYEDAGLQGLCAEGRWEAAVGAIRALDLQALLSTRDTDDRLRSDIT